MKNMTRSLCARASELIRAGTDGVSLSYSLASVLDCLITDIFDQVSRDGGDGISLVAVGGYGRREMAPFSDIDIMFLVKERTSRQEETAKEILYRLWDTGLTIGHSFRTMGECVEEGMKEIQTRTALMESRFLSGDRMVFEEFRRDVFQRILFKKRKEFLGEVMRENDKRQATYGSSIYLLQPNLKEGRGGLRDIHTISWLSRVSLMGGVLPGNPQRIMKAHDFLLLARACLHVVSNRRNDILSFEYQEGVARMLGLKDTRRFHSSEIMMRLLHRKTHDVHDSLRSLISTCSRQYVRTYLSIPVDWSVRRITDEFFISRGEITVRTMDSLKNPDKILELFKIFSSTGRRLSHQVREFIKERSVFFPLRKSPSRRAVGFFLEILKSNRVYETLREMNDTGVLGRFIPEFGRLRHLVIHEPYHRYTVDEHTLIAIRNLEELKKTKVVKLRKLREIMTAAVRQDLLYLAILLHDVGKAESPRTGRRRMSHEEEGYNRIKALLERLGLEKEERLTVEFLVKNHILLSRLALSRDPEEPETIEQLADTAGNEANLEALYLMTYADMSAVNPDFWTDWKAYILHDLFTRAMALLRGNRLYYGTVTDPALKAFVMDMPERYLISGNPETIRRDYEISRELEKTPLALAITERTDGTAELSVITRDLPGLFFRIAIVIGRKGLNILRARFYTGKSGLVIDKIILSNWRDLWWEGLEEQIRDNLIGTLREPLPAGQGTVSSQVIPLKIVPGRFESFVEIDNEASGECSVMEVFTTDRLGLIYDISSRFHSHGVDIISAVINTEDGIAQDVFYLQEKGGKLDSDKTMGLLFSVKEIATCLSGSGA